MDQQYKDIVGLSVKHPDEGDVMRVYTHRRQMMKAGRSYREHDWDTSDAQAEAPVSYDNRGRLNVNAPTAQNLIEIHVGRQAGQIIFNVEPDGGKADIEELQPAKYILEYYIEQGNFYEEKKQFELDKAKYGTAVFYCGLTQSIEEMYEFQEGTENDDDNEYWSTKGLSMYIKESRYFTPKNVPIRNFWVDEKALYQPCFEYARDCIMQEEISLEEVNLRRGKNKFFRNIKDITPIGNLDPAYSRTNNSTDKVIIHYYYNRITKDFWIIANYTIAIFIGKQLYKHGRLPFAVAQHYPINNCIYGRGVPRKVRYIQAYKSQMMQNGLDKTQMSSGINLGIGNNGEVASELFTSPGEINIRRFTESLQNVQQYQLDGNITGIINLLTVIDDFIIQDTGDNIKAPYKSPAGTLGEVEIMEENKAIRQKSIDEARDIALDKSLTMSLCNIQQFASKLQSKVEKDESGNVIKVEFPMIIIPNTFISKEGKRKEYITDYGNFGYFEFRPDSIKSPLRVKVTTSSTKTSLKTLERNAFTQFIQNLSLIAPVYPQILQQYPVEKITSLMNLVYGYDTKMTADTRKDKIRQDNIEIGDEIRNLLGFGNSLTPNQNNEQNPQLLQQPIPQPEEPNLGEMAGIG